MKKTLSVALTFFATLGLISGNAQTLFTYGNHKVSKQEFLRVYEKNNVQKKPDYSAASVNEYLNLYALFKMKVQEAEEIHLDTTTALRNELNNYKAQLARAYLTDADVNKKLVEEAYERMKSDVKVSHILIALRPADDSAVIKAKADSVYQLIVSKKADFAALAKSISDDKATGEKGGELGYLTALQVVYPFETMAYNTPVGQISKPFLTQFGYHIIKVEDKRPAKGEIQVAQIMIATPKSKGEEGKVAAREKMSEVQAKLKQGTPFEELVSTYSDDRYTNKKDGVLDPFGVGKVTPIFEETAFALKNPGDISQPFETEYGIHILKLIKKTPLQPFEDIRDEIARKVENDSRAAIAKEAYMAKTRKQFNFKEHTDNLNEFIDALAEDTAKTIDQGNYAGFKKPLFELNKKTYHQDEFLNYIMRLTNGNLRGNKTSALNDLYQVYTNSIIQDLQQDLLEKENADFRNLIGEYRNGIMLFDLMDSKVWSKASSDTIGLTRFYEKNREKYQWQPGFEGELYTTTNEDDLKALKAELDKGTEAGEAIKAMNTPERRVNISTQAGRFEFNRLPLSRTDYNAGSTTRIFQNEDRTYSLVKVNEIYDQDEVKTLEEAKGFVVTDYQDFLEKEWNQQLKDKYPLKVNEKVLKSIVSK